MKKFETIYQEADLVKKHLLQEATEAERQELEHRMAASPELRKVVGQLQEEGSLKGAFAEYSSYSSKKAYQDFLRKTQSLPTEQSQHKSFHLRRWSAVAVALLVVGLSFYMINTLLQRHEERMLIQPGTQHAQLMLSDGNVIDMCQQEVKVIVDGVQLQYRDGVLTYNSNIAAQPKSVQKEAVKGKQETLDSALAGEQPVLSNELITPRGGENTVVLEDGTTVHLNAGSRLTYPVRFGGKRRLVVLEGEAFFDVASDAQRPFVVRTHIGDVTVLGTAFNVYAYADSPVCYTTLVRGKVKVSSPTEKNLILSPGEQAVVSTRNTTKRKVNLEEYVGWVSGTYVFNNRRLGDIMKAFERWYNIKVVYEIPALKNITYSGSLKRDATINSFLDALELTGDLEYEIRDKNVIYIRQGEY